VKPPLQNPKTQNPKLAKVFFSDDGSDGDGSRAQAGLRISPAALAIIGGAETSRRAAEPRFLSLEGAYHGDTIGAVSLGHIDLFSRAYGRMLFQDGQGHVAVLLSLSFNRAKPERAGRARISQMQLGMKVAWLRKNSAAKTKRKSYMPAVCVER